MKTQSCAAARRWLIQRRQKKRTRQFTAPTTGLDLFAVNHGQQLLRGRGAKNFAEAAARPQMARLIKHSEGLTEPRPRLSAPALFSDRPPAPVNVSVTHLRSDSATVSWEVPEGDIIIGFSILQQVRSSLPVYSPFPSRSKFSVCYIVR